MDCVVGESDPKCARCTTGKRSCLWKGETRHQWYAVTLSRKTAPEVVEMESKEEEQARQCRCFVSPGTLSVLILLLHKLTMNDCLEGRGGSTAGPSSCPVPRPRRAVQRRVNDPDASAPSREEFTELQEEVAELRSLLKGFAGLINKV